MWHADQHQPAAWASLACGSGSPSDISGVAFETGGRLADPDWLPEHGVGLAACSAMEVPHQQLSLLDWCRLHFLGALSSWSSAAEPRCWAMDKLQGTRQCSSLPQHAATATVQAVKLGHLHDSPLMPKRTCCAVQVQVWRIRARSEEEPQSEVGGTLPTDELFYMSRSQGLHTGGQPPLTAVALWSTSRPARTLFLALGDAWGGVEVLELRATTCALRWHSAHSLI